MFSKETYSKRREALRKQFKSGILLFLGNEESGMNYADNTYHFRQDSSFLYYFGLSYPGIAAIIDIDQGEDIVFGDDLTIDHIVWMGSQPTMKERMAPYGINHVQPSDELAAYLQEAQSQGRKVHFLPPYRDEHRVKLFRWLGIHPDHVDRMASVPFITAVGEQRNIKSAEEIVQLEEAVNTTVKMHQAAMRYARPGMLEAEVAAKVHEVALAANGNISFPIIATINGQTLHNHEHGNIIKEGDLFLLDAGAENAMGYAGDMSSTFPVSPTFTSQQKEIYQVALNAHNAAIEALKPGVAFKEVHLLAARKVVEGMKDLGFMKGNTQSAVEAGAHALFFPCGLGHMMGLDVHDMENLGEQYIGYGGEPKSTQFGLKSLRLGRELKPGYVLTIEPGVYFIPELIDLWRGEKQHTDFINFDKVSQYKAFGGTRNEEDILITEDGYRILGEPLAKSIADVEAERAKAF
jgi:Xaa-Pro aminopeptidase